MTNREFKTQILSEFQQIAIRGIIDFSFCIKPNQKIVIKQSSNDENIFLNITLTTNNTELTQTSYQNNILTKINQCKKLSIKILDQTDCEIQSIALSQEEINHLKFLYENASIKIIPQEYQSDLLKSTETSKTNSENWEKTTQFNHIDIIGYQVSLSNITEITVRDTPQQNPTTKCKISKSNNETLNTIIEDRLNEEYIINTKLAIEDILNDMLHNINIVNKINHKIIDKLTILQSIEYLYVLISQGFKSETTKNKQEQDCQTYLTILNKFNNLNCNIPANDILSQTETIIQILKLFSKSNYSDYADQLLSESNYFDHADQPLSELSENNYSDFYQ